MGYEIEFYRTENGRKPVEDFIQSLQEKQIAKILRDITLLQDKGADLRYPYVDYIKGDKYNGLMELRTKQGGGIFRTFYFVVVKDRETKTEKAVLLHAIQKKTNKPPKRELDTALSRMKDYKSRGGVKMADEFDTFKAKLLKNPQIKAEYDALAPEYELIEQLITARTERKMTQKQLAEKLGTSQSSIARLESGNCNPSFQFLQRVAVALDKRLSFVLS